MGRNTAAIVGEDVILNGIVRSTQHFKCSAINYIHARDVHTVENHAGACGCRMQDNSFGNT